MNDRLRVLIRGAFFLKCNGYAAALRDHVALLDSLDLDVHLENYRPLCKENLDDRPGSYDRNIVERLVDSQDLVKWRPDVCINYLAPNVAKQHQGCRNVIFVYWETTRVPGHDQEHVPASDTNNWVRIMNAYDEVWTASPFSKAAFIESGVVVPVRVVPWCLDEKSFDRPAYDKRQVVFRSVRDGVDMSLQAISERYRVLYCSVGEWQPRKNYRQLIHAFIHAFLTVDDVALLIKTSDNGIGKLDDRSIADAVVRCIEEINVCDQSPPAIFLNTQPLDEGQFLGVINQCDYYFTCTHGEGMGGPLLMSLAQGTPLICSRHTAVADYASCDNAILYPFRYDYICGMTSPHYDARQMWATFNLLDVSKSLHESYRIRSTPTYERMCAAAIATARSEFSRRTLSDVLHQSIADVVNVGGRGTG